MSLASIKTKQEECLNDIYASLENQGATIPEKKNLVNVAPAIESIEGGGSEPTPPQVINYTMLYDGSLGEAGENGANVCADVTGGYNLNGHSLSTNGIAEFQGSNIYLKTTNYTKSSFCTNNKVNIAGYSKLYIITKGIFKYYGQYDWMAISLGDVANVENAEMNHRIGIAGSKDGNKLVSTADLSSAQIQEYYFQGFVASASSSGLDPSATLYMYGASLMKQDNWQELCTVAGLNSSDYTDESALCSDSTAMETILNNKEVIKYMIYNCTGTFMGEFIRSSVALTELNKSSYKTLVYANEHWLKFLSFVM